MVRNSLYLYNPNVRPHLASRMISMLVRTPSVPRLIRLYLKCRKISSESMSSSSVRSCLILSIPEQVERVTALWLVQTSDPCVYVAVVQVQALFLYQLLAN